MATDPARFRVVLDTNVLVSGTIVVQGPSAAILTAWHRGRFILLISAWQRAELARVLARPRLIRKYHLTDDRLAAFFLLVDTLTTPVEPLRMLPLVVRDPQDEPILGMALAGRATHLVTGDDDLLVLAGDAARGDLRIVPPRIFLDELARWGGGDDA